HMPEGFTKALADRLNGISQLTVVEAEDGMKLENGHGYIAPGHSHIIVSKMGLKRMIMLSKKGKVSGHQPSVDVLFESVANVYGKKAIGIIMTGMGKDGSQSIKLMKDAGAHTIAQSEVSCCVFGMPNAAIKLGAIDEILSLEAIALKLKNLIRNQK
ncbi:hypothetical protein BVY03_01360, partial [bacterium K02(2017)]